MSQSNGSGGGTAGGLAFVLRGRAPALVAVGPHVYLTVEIEVDRTLHVLQLGPLPPDEVERWRRAETDRVEVEVRVPAPPPIHAPPPPRSNGHSNGISRGRRALRGLLGILDR